MRQAHSETQTQPPALPWHLGLESWCADHFGISRLTPGERPEFAPFEAHKPERFYHVPVVLLVLTSATRPIHQAFAEAAELIRVSTAGFRPVLVTDLYRSPALDACDWPVEQILPEEAWLAQHPTNWLNHAAAHLRTAQQYFGASYVLGLRDEADAHTALGHLARTYNAQESVLIQALRIFTSGLRPNGCGEGFRHGWEDLGAGQRQQRRFFSHLGAEVDVDLYRGTGAGVILAAGASVPEEVLEAAQSSGMSTAVMNAPGAEHGGESFAAAVARACADALRQGGPTLAASAGAPAAELGADGWLDTADQSQWTVELESVGSIRFPPQQAHRVLAEVQGLYGKLLG